MGAGLLQDEFRYKWVSVRVYSKPTRISVVLGVEEQQMV
jgi:hypothetical protein